MTTPSILLDSLHQKISTWVDQRQLPGVAILAMQGQTLLDESYFGYGDVENAILLDNRSIFRLASASKIFVSVAFLKLVDQGLVQLSDPVSMYLPEYQSPDVFTSAGNIIPATRTLTILDLLRHSNGFAYGDNEPYQSALSSAGLLDSTNKFGLDWSHGFSLRDWAARLSTVPMEFEPGTAVTYGLGHDLIGAIIEVITGVNAEQFFKDALFDPLGLANTFFTVPQDRQSDLTNFYSRSKDDLVCIEQSTQSPFLIAPRAISGGGGWDMFGNGGLVSNSRDFSRLLRMILAGGTLDGVRILEPGTASLLKSNQTQAIGKILPGNGYSYGFASLIDEAKAFGGSHSGKMWWGGSTNTHFWFDPELDFHGIFLTHTFPFRHLDAAATVDKLFYQIVTDQPR